MTQTKQDRGFFAAVPRILRTQYKDLNASEKWLYVCLKDLCGDTGTCFRTLATLAEETGLSTGSLSTMIPALQKAHLIQAEKKARGLGGKKVWHITIADIWQRNQLACSTHEQQSSNIEQYSGNLQILNNTPPSSSNFEASSSNFEASSSNFVDRRRTNEERTMKNITTGDASENIEVIHPSYPFLSFDSLEYPTVMTITFEDDERAEITNDGYSHVAEEVAATLSQQGIHVEIRQRAQAQHSYSQASSVPASGESCLYEEEGKAVGTGKVEGYSSDSGQSSIPTASLGETHKSPKNEKPPVRPPSATRRAASARAAPQQSTLMIASEQDRAVRAAETQRIKDSMTPDEPKVQVKPETKKQYEQRIVRLKEEKYALYERLMGGRVMREKHTDGVMEWWAEAEIPDSEIEATIKAMKTHAFWKNNITPQTVEKQRLCQMNLQSEAQARQRANSGEGPLVASPMVPVYQGNIASPITL